MRAKPWDKWTVEGLRQMAKNHGPSMVSEALKDFAALKEAEQRGERCVLPVDVVALTKFYVQTDEAGTVAFSLRCRSEFKPTKEAAIEDLARKIKEAK